MLSRYMYSEQNNCEIDVIIVQKISQHVKSDNEWNEIHIVKWLHPSKARPRVIVTECLFGKDGVFLLNH